MKLNIGFHKLQNEATPRHKNLGEFYLNPSGFGIDGEPQYAEAIKWLRKATEQGEASAQSNLGGVLRWQGCRAILHRGC